MQTRLDRADRARREFVANASHELRTPLFSLGGFLELLDDEDIDDDTRAGFLREMREQVSRLTKLATDLLDLSRLDADAVQVQHEPIDLAVNPPVAWCASSAGLRPGTAAASPWCGRPGTCRMQSATSSACSRSGAPCWTTRSGTIPTASRCGSRSPQRMAWCGWR